MIEEIIQNLPEQEKAPGIGKKLLYLIGSSMNNKLSERKPISTEAKSETLEAKPSTQPAVVVPKKVKKEASKIVDQILDTEPVDEIDQQENIELEAIE